MIATRMESEGGHPMSYGQGDKLHLILNAAYELFGSNGFYETKMSDIADLAGIAKGTLYLYFTSKEQLFAAITKRDFDQFLGDIEQGLCSHDTLEQQLRFVADYHLRYYFERRAYTNLFFKAPNNDPEMMAALKDFIERYMRLLADLLEACDIPDAKLYAKSFVGILDMMKMDILFTPEFKEQDLKQRIEFSANLFMNGCRIKGFPYVSDPKGYTNTPLEKR